LNTAISQSKGKIKYPTQRVNVDFTVEMLKELDEIASELKKGLEKHLFKMLNGGK